METQTAEKLAELVAAEAAKGPGSGRYLVSVIAQRGVIGLALSQGYTYKTVWRALRRVNKIEMSYDRFRVLCRGLGLRPLRLGAVYRKTTETPAQIARSSPASASPPQRQPPRRADGFVHPNDVSPEDLY